MKIGTYDSHVPIQQLTVEQSCCYVFRGPVALIDGDTKASDRNIDEVVATGIVEG